MEHYVVCVRSNQEDKAGRQVEKQDRSARIYFPRIRSIIKPRNYRAERVIVRPMFPGYIFVAFPFRVNWYAIREASACVGCVYFDGKPAYVSDEVIYNLRRQEQYESMDWPNPPPPELQSKKVKNGDSVKVIEGPFKDLVGKVVKTSHSSVKVELRIFGRPTQTDMPYELFQILSG